MPFAGIKTSQPPFTVTVWTRMSLLTHSIVSPTRASISAGTNAIFSMVTRIVLASASATQLPSTSPAMAMR
ncbi:hypothetical protein D3C87_2138620 [compost metagenome]